MKTRQLKKKFNSYLEAQERDPYSTEKIQAATMKMGLTAEELVRRLVSKADAIADEVEAFKAEKCVNDALMPYIAKKVGTSADHAPVTPKVVIMDFTNLYATPQQKEKNHQCDLYRHRMIP